MGAPALIRPAAARDLPTLHRLWREADGLPPVAGAQVLPLHRYLLERGTTLIAERDGVPVGFAAAVEQDGVVLLSDVFVTQQGQGIGRQLLDGLFARHPSPRRYTAASSDPRAVPLYRSFGMDDRGRLTHLEWRTPSHGALVAEVPTRVLPIDAQIVGLLNGWFGRDRSGDLGYWSSLGAIAVVVGDPAIGAGLVCPSTPWVPSGSATRLGPIASREGDRRTSDARDVVLAVLAAALDLPGRATGVRIVIGEAHPAHADLLGLGFETVDADTYLASDDSICDLARHVGAADLW